MIGKSILPHIQTKGPGQPHDVSNINFLGDGPKLLWSLRLDIFKDQSNEFIVLVEVDVQRVLLVVLVSCNVLDYFYLSRLVLVEVVRGIRVLVD